MALKKVSNLTEGPWDYMKGAAARVSAGVQSVHQAGVNSSAQAELPKAIATLAELIKAVAAATPAPKQAPQQARPQYGQPSQYTMTFSSFVQSFDGEQLDEGVWDFVKGAGAEVRNKVSNAINDYASRPSALKDIVNAGKDAHAAASHQDTVLKLEKQTQVVQGLIKRIDPAQRKAIVRQAIISAAQQVGVNPREILNQILGQSAQQQQPAPQQAAPQQTPVNMNHSWQQGQPPAAPATQPTQQAAPRPSRRRLRPVAPG